MGLSRITHGYWIRWEYYAALAAYSCSSGFVFGKGVLVLLVFAPGFYVLWRETRKGAFPVAAMGVMLSILVSSIVTRAFIDQPSGLYRGFMVVALLGMAGYSAYALRHLLPPPEPVKFE